MSLVDFDLDQPRRHVDPEHLAELAESMDVNGLVQPVLLRPVDGRLLVVAGERRVRAAQVLGWNTIPAVVRDVDPADVPWTQLVENLQRADLSPAEEAAAYKRLVDAGHSHAAVAARVGKKKSYVSQKLRLLDLPGSLVQYLDHNVLSEGHIRQLLRLKATLDGVTVGEVVSRDTDWSTLPASPVDADDVAFGIIACRPLGWPALYPVLPDADHPRLAVMVAATEVMYSKMTPTTGWWTVAAWWWATVSVAVELSVAQLDRQLDTWLDHIVSAVLTVEKGWPPNPYASVYFDDNGIPKPGAPPLLAFEWWGYSSDLRHAGLGCLKNDQARVARWLVGPARQAMKRVCNGGLLAPSICQPGAPDHDPWAEASERAGR